MDVVVYAASSFQAPKWFSICTNILVWKKAHGCKNSQSIIIRWGLFFIVSYGWFWWSLCTGEQFHRECCVFISSFSYFSEHLFEMNISVTDLDKYTCHFTV